ncbi:nose resistant to fluoxetine protein 6-like [Uloborus diversus]|uniref:nose resistant to fluoxetine protein 6-like n=1 Tax=Uloborus diversus TaxID=327109 RepID=UPI00240A17CE|nr:nose resistant to fluoxetine protein 6-like [Uloborus diversus]
MGVVVFLALVGTVVDMIWSSEEMESRGTKSMVFNTVKSFSVFSNARKLSDFTCPQDNLGFVYGMVFIVFCWVVVSNTFMYVNYDVTSNFVEALRILQNIFYEIVLNRVLPLQVLFFISGFLMTYRWIKGSEKNFHVCKFLFKKYIRYTVAYGLIIALVIISPSFGSGPSWSNYLTPMYKKCANNWWYNLLYINNFLETENSCLEHTWVFAITAQLYIVGVFVILVLKLNPKVGLMFMFFLTVASLASVALTNVYYDLPPNEMSAFLDNRDRFFYAEHSHYRLYTHISIYCAGIFVGYFTAKNPDIKISRKMSWILWVTTTSGFIAALCTVHEWRSGYLPSPMVAAVYSAFSKVAEMAFLSWLTTACMTGHAGGLTALLSWRPFCFLARLTFIAYAMHVPIITMLNGFRKSHMFISQLEIFYVVLSYAAATYVVSYILHLFFEAPWISLSDVIRRRSNVKTFTCYENSAMTEKPVKNGEKPISITVNNKNWMNSLEKGC